MTTDSKKDNKKYSANRIPFEQVENTDAVSAWTMPSMDKKSKVIKSAELEEKNRKNRANEIIENVPAAKKPRQLTAQELLTMAEEAKKEGYEQGYQEGNKKGLADGLKKGEQEGKRQAFTQTKAKLDQEHKRIQTIANALLEPMQEQDRLLENVIVDMAMNFAKGILRQELQFHPGHLLSVVNTALNALPVGAKNIEVSVNQDDADLLDTIVDPAERHWRVRIDNSLGPGGCRIETQESLVDYSIESRLARYFTDVFKAGDPDPGSLAQIEDYGPVKSSEVDACAAKMEDVHDNDPHNGNDNIESSDTD